MVIIKIKEEDTIVGISTSLGESGINIIRLSGENSIEIASKMFISKKGKNIKELKSHTINYGEIIDNDRNVVDEVLLSIMNKPNTYTKEDVIEINCHGGSFVTQKILELTLNNGARLALNGEFTKRAFLNGRLDLSQAEAVMDVISAKTSVSHNLAKNQLLGNVKNAIHNLRDRVLDIVAEIEALIDYPEHDEGDQTYDILNLKCNDILTEIENIVKNSENGKIFRVGINIAIIGKPNVGKSSLLNKFLNEERAIVTDIAGTTRDTLYEYLNLDGIPIKMIDTAGIRETSDIVENIGIKKAIEQTEHADLIICMLDNSNTIEKEDLKIFDIIKDKKALIILNKSDICKCIDIKSLCEYCPEKYIFEISVKNEHNLESIKNCVKELFFAGDITVDDKVMLTNTRHLNALTEAKINLEKTINTIKKFMPVDFVSMDLQLVLENLGEITGDVFDEEIIDRIFSKFCLGK